MLNILNVCWYQKRSLREIFKRFFRLLEEECCLWWSPLAKVSWETGYFAYYSIISLVRLIMLFPIIMENLSGMFGCYKQHQSISLDSNNFPRRQLITVSQLCASSFWHLLVELNFSCKRCLCEETSKCSQLELATRGKAALPWEQICTGTKKGNDP